MYENSYYNSRSKWTGKNTYHKARFSTLCYIGGAVLILLIVAVIIAAIVKNVTKNNSSAVPENPNPVAQENVSAAAVESEESTEPEATAAPTQKPRSKAVALTFDDGPSTANTPQILSLLKKYNAHATFFVVGNRVEAGADLLKKEIEIGCEIGNHSWDHANLSNMTMKQVNKNLNKTKKIVKKLTGYTVTLTRPPYGAISTVMRKKMDTPMILWSVDTLDWKSKNAKAVLKQVKKQVRDGAIILVHDIHESTAESMKTVLPWLIKNDYDILTVSELMERKGIKLKAGKAYCNGD
jgi:peptidoglycan/xylan/chitin deacetylase (PgdA/CDA1 family)